MNNCDNLLSDEDGITYDCVAYTNDDGLRMKMPIGKIWRKTSRNGRPYVKVRLDKVITKPGHRVYATLKKSKKGPNAHKLWVETKYFSSLMPYTFECLIDLQEKLVYAVLPVQKQASK